MIIEYQSNLKAQINEFTFKNKFFIGHVSSFDES